jgi:DNA primase
MQVTALRPDGLGKAAWRKTRHTFGRVRGGAVRLGPPLPGRGERALAVAEGVETALGFSRLSGYSCWAALGGSLASFDPPAELDELVIAADHDQTGLRLAHKLALRLSAARPSLFVEIRHPVAEGHDWADEACAAFGDG